MQNWDRESTQGCVVRDGNVCFQVCTGQIAGKELGDVQLAVSVVFCTSTLYLWKGTRDLTAACDSKQDQIISTILGITLDNSANTARRAGLQWSAWKGSA